MNFDQWRIGNDYTPSELTQMVQEAIPKYQTGFAYNYSKKPNVQEANVKSEICSLEECVEKKFTSLEIEFMRYAPASGKHDMVYLWLKFLLVKGHYRLNSSIKSRYNQNYLREKPELMMYE